MFSFKHAAMAALAMTAVGTAAHAEDTSRWFVHVGPALIHPDASDSMTADGQPVPGSNVHINEKWTGEFEVGRYLTRNVAITIAGGYPPTFDIQAAGTVASFGKIGEMTGGPAGVMVQYHFLRDGAFQPYLGAGGAVLVVFGTKDGALSNLRAATVVGPAVQAGADYWLNDHWGVFVDVKKAWISTTAKGTLGGVVPVRADVQVNPIVPSFGVSYRF